MSKQNITHFFKPLPLGDRDPAAFSPSSGAPASTSSAKSSRLHKSLADTAIINKGGAEYFHIVVF
jgi:hypothetical protein